jgi:hypothetical protein
MVKKNAIFPNKSLDLFACEILNQKFSKQQAMQSTLGGHRYEKVSLIPQFSI